jgi:hypothetical protein
MHMYCPSATFATEYDVPRLRDMPHACIQPKGKIPLTLHQILSHASLFPLYCAVLMGQRGLEATLWCAPGFSGLLSHDSCRPWYSNRITLIVPSTVHVLVCVESDSLRFIVMLKFLATKKDRHLQSATIPHSECLRTAWKQTQRNSYSAISNMSYRISVLLKRGSVCTYPACKKIRGKHASVLTAYSRFCIRSYLFSSFAVVTIVLWWIWQLLGNGSVSTAWKQE